MAFTFSQFEAYRRQDAEAYEQARQCTVLRRRIEEACSWDELSELSEQLRQATEAYEAATKASKKMAEDLVGGS